jgi:hypothetical protein
VGQAAFDTCNPRQVSVVGIGVNDVAENDVTDVFDIDSGAGDGLPHTRCGHLTGWAILQAAAVPADCRSNSAQNYNFSIHIKLGETLFLVLKNWFSLSAPGAPAAGIFASSLVSAFLSFLSGYENRLYRPCPILTILWRLQFGGLNLSPVICH